MTNVIVTITGPSGAGKSTLEKLMVERLNFSKVISVTTRQPRDKEIDGKDYYFRTPKEFETLIETNQLAQYIKLFTNDYYGSLISEFDRAFNKNLPVVFVGAPNSIMQIRHFAETRTDVKVFSLFLTNTKQELVTRMLSRVQQVDDASYLAKRIINLIDVEHTEWANQATYDDFRTFDAMTENSVLQIVENYLSSVR